MKLLEYLFGCRHERYTWPLTLVRGSTYVRCLDCGKALRYSFEEMKFLKGEPDEESSVRSVYFPIAGR